MSEKIAPTKAKSDLKSGVDFKSYTASILGGNPPKKCVEQIEKENTPKKAPGSTRA